MEQPGIHKQVLGLFAVLLIVGGVVWTQPDEASLRALEDDAFRVAFTKQMDQRYASGGSAALVEPVRAALAAGRIDMFTCHGLAHDIGHYLGYPENFAETRETLSKELLNLCNSGIIHGIEGELALDPHTYKETLFTFCQDIRPFKPTYRGCYHGAGHTFMELATTPEAALAQCETLRYTDELSPEHCYRGVLSEHHDRVLREGGDARALIKGCAALPERLQRLCALELNGLVFGDERTTADFNEKLEQCVTFGRTPDVTEGCIASVSWAAADVALADGMLVPLAFALTLPPELQLIYINHTFVRVDEMERYGPELSVREFCTAFSGDIQDECLQYARI